MFGIDSPELLLILIVTLLVLGPKDLPRAAYKIGKLLGQARGAARHFQTGINAMIREAELEELKAKWQKENGGVVAADPFADVTDWTKPMAGEEAAQLAPGEAEPDPDPELQYGRCRLDFRASANLETAVTEPEPLDADPIAVGELAAAAPTQAAPA